MLPNHDARPLRRADARPLIQSVRSLAILALTAACGGGGGDSGPIEPPPPPSNAVATVEVAPLSASLQVGETLRLTATAKNSSGTVVTGKPTTWQSSANTIASVGTDGTVTALAAGAAQVTATVEGKSGSMSVAVQAPAKVHSIQLNYPTASLALGQELKLLATLFDSAGRPVTKTNLSWASADTNVVGVDATGAVTATGTGQSQVMVSIDGVSRTSTLTVIAFASVEAGPNVTCALTAAGVAYCAGAGIGPLATRVGGDLRFATLESDGQPVGGTWQMCGQTLDGKTYCWGTNIYGQLGVGDLVFRNAPTLVTGDPTFVQVSVGRSHACALTAAGDAYCWGGNNFDSFWQFNDRGALGVGDTLSRSVPTAVVGGHKFKQIEAGWGTTCGLTTANEAYCWGNNDLGQVGNGANFGSSDSFEHTPRKVAGNLLFKQVVTKGPRSCGLRLDGRAYCWGNNAVYETGAATALHTCSGARPCSGTPVAVEGSATFQSLSTSQFATCGITADGDTLCWGLNRLLLFGTQTLGGCHIGVQFLCTATPVEGPEDMVSVSVGVEHSCGMARNGIALCWGGNTVGQRGWPGTTSVSTPRAFSIAPQQ